MDFDNSDVRRQDRLLGEERACEILRQGEYGVLSMQAESGRGAYGIPVSFAWDGENAIYMHCAPQGRKLRCIDACAEVSFCVVGRTKVIPAGFTTAYESIVVRGRAERGLGDDERLKALALLLDKYCPDDKETGLQYARKSFARAEIIRLDILSASGKSKNCF